MDRTPLSRAEVERIEQQVGSVRRARSRTSCEKRESCCRPCLPTWRSPWPRRLHDSQFRRVRVRVARAGPGLGDPAGRNGHGPPQDGDGGRADDAGRPGPDRPLPLPTCCRGGRCEEVRDLLVSQMAEEKALYDRLLAQALRLGAQALSGETRGGRVRGRGLPHRRPAGVRRHPQDEIAVRGLRGKVQAGHAPERVPARRGLPDLHRQRDSRGGHPGAERGRLARIAGAGRSWAFWGSWGPRGWITVARWPWWRPRRNCSAGR